jgi:ligand-binding sensor domain-containing protein
VPWTAAFECGALAVDADRSHLWVATGEGVVRVGLAGGERTSLRTSDGLASNRVAAILADATGHVWFGYGDSPCDAGRCGLSRFSPASGAWDHFGASDLVDDRVYALAQDGEGAVWVATPSGATAYWPGGAWEMFFDWHDCKQAGDHCKPIWSYRVADLVSDASGAVWFALDLMTVGVSPKPGGVARRRAESRTDTWDKSDGLPTNQAVLVAAGGGEVWMSAGPDSGIARFDSASGRWVDVAHVDATDLAVAGDGTLWVATETGARSRSVDGAWKDWNSGLPSMRVNRLLSFDSSVCFATSAGVACLDTKSSTWSHPYVP